MINPLVGTSAEKMWHIKFMSDSDLVDALLKAKIDLTEGVYDVYEVRRNNYIMLKIECKSRMRTSRRVIWNKVKELVNSYAY
jgi:hypothetical protein